MQSGMVEALNYQAAIQTLQDAGLIILKLEPISRVPLFAKQLTFFQRVKNRELVNFTRQLATLFSSKVPLLISLQVLAKQSEGRYLKDVVLEIAGDVEGGALFSKALAKHPKVFSDLFVNMVKSGEASGSLEKTLLYLADYLEKQYYLMSKIRGAMIYPAFILFGFLVVAVLMLVMVIPNLINIVKESGQELPAATKAIIFLSDFLRAWGWLVFFVLIGGLAWFFYAIKKSPAARFFWDRSKLRIPILGKILRKIYVARLADNLGVLIRGGVSVLQALQISAEVVGNVIFRNIILDAKERVRAGESISGALEKHKEIPSLVTQMIATGEQVGALDDILEKLSKFYSPEIEATVDTLLKLIEPILIVVLGIGVAFMIAAVLMPIYNIAGGM